MPSQESSLRHHAEKKALAALLERDGANAAADQDLALAVNIKVCADCHEFFKGAALLLGRTIRVQEPGLLHVFAGGGCSCLDEWRWEERVRQAPR